MDEAVRQQLMVQVERCVRPIKASNVRKDRMRRELLSHLTEAYNKELASNNDVQQALLRALQRFGDSDAIRQDLQASIGRAERLLFHPLTPDCIRRWVRRRAGESAWRHAFRTGSLSGAWFCVVFAVLSPLPLVSAALSGMPVDERCVQQALLVLAYAVFGGLAIFTGQVLTCLKTGAVIERGLLSVRSLSTTLLAVAGACGLVLGTLTVANHAGRVQVFPVTDPRFVFCVALAAAVVFEGVTGLAVPDRRRSDDWESLEIDA